MKIETDVLIIGGGFAGVGTAQDLAKNGIKSTLVDKKDYFEVTFANLRNLTDPSKNKNRARKYYKDFLKSDFIQTSVNSLNNQEAELSNGDLVRFKRAIIASGTRYPSMSVAKSNHALTLNQRNQEFVEQHENLKNADSVLVIGGGVVGVELAGEIASAFPDKKVTLSHSGSALLDGFKQKAQIKAQQQLMKQGVSIEFNRRYQEQNDYYIDLKSGQKSHADLTFEAVGAVPNNAFLKPYLTDILNAKGLVKVDEKFTVKGHTNLYALGDIADVAEAKLGYLAHQQGAHLAKIITADMAGKKAKAYKTNPLMALIPTGQSSGVMQLPFAVTTLNFMINIKQKDLFINKIYKAFGTLPNSD
jgi:NADH dehydrogenase FAD-containing subunit